MGMFDTVWATCPECHVDMGLQTKGGLCLLDNYPEYKVPFDAAASLLSPYHYAKDVYGHITCENCQTKLYLTVIPTLAPNYAVVQLHKVNIDIKHEREQYE